MSRLIFPVSPRGDAVAASQVKYEGGSLAIIARLRVDQIRALGAGVTRTIVQFPGLSDTRFRVGGFDATHVQFSITDTNNGTNAQTEILRTDLPADGNDIIVYMRNANGAGGRAIAVFTAAGVGIGTDLSTTGGATATGTGNGAIRLGNDGVTGWGANIDCVAVLNAARTGAARAAKPVPSDTDVVGLYYLAEGSGSTAADAKAGGTALTLSDITWATGGVWNDAGATPTISSIAPTSGAVGTEITITGTNLTGTSAGTMGPTVALTGIVVDSATQVRATIAAGSPASGTIRLTTPGGTAVGPTFTITPIYTDVVVTNPNGSGVVGVLLAPITARAIDQFGNTFLGTVPADGAIPAGFCGVDELALGYAVTGTTVEAFVAGTATFDNLTPIEDAGGPPIEVITVATPLRCTVDLYPKTSEAVNATSGGGIPTLIARTASDHLLRVQDIVNDVTGAPVEPTAIRYRVADSAGSLVDESVTDPTNPDDWQIALSRTLFTPTRGPMTLTLTLVAPSDATETVLTFTLIQGVRQ